MDVIPAIPWRFCFQDEMPEYWFRLVRLIRVKDVVNIIDEKGISIIIKRLQGGRDREQTMNFTFMMKFLNRIVKNFLLLLFIAYLFGCL